MTDPGYRVDYVLTNPPFGKKSSITMTNEEGEEEEEGDVGSEAAEEYLQAQIEPVLSNIILETEEEINPVSQESLESALLGGFMAAVLNIPSTAAAALTPAKATHNEATTAALLRPESRFPQFLSKQKNP